LTLRCVAVVSRNRCSSSSDIQCSWRGV
jgi:hypothetical protein